MLVNNAGGAFGAAPVAEADSDDWRRMFEVNVIGLMQVTRALLPALIASGDGVIVNVGSTAGRIAYEGGGGYTAAKHGTQVVSETLRLELWDQPVRVCEIAPGMVKTDEFALVRFDGDREKAEADLPRRTEPADRRGRRRRDHLDGHPALPREHRRAGDPATRAGGAAQGPPASPWKSERMASGMKTIGLVGGMSWESSAVYYRDLNLGVQKRLGGLASPRLVMSTVDFAELTELEDAERWDQVGALLAEAGRNVERGGADFLLLCTTTFHKVADQVAAAVDIPLLHLADVVADACAKAGVTRVAFIGTTVAMSDGFFTDRMASHELEVLVPPASEHDWLNSAIYEELVHGHVLDRTRRRVVELIHQLWDAGAEGVLLGCTELELLIHQADVDLPVFPCTTLHVEAALDRALS